MTVCALTKNWLKKFISAVDLPINTITVYTHILSFVGLYICGIAILFPSIPE